MTIESELSNFYKKHGFGDNLGSRPLTVGVYTGCLLVPMPNIETRNKYLKYHDLHHLVTEYSVGRIGEGEISAWELGTGSFFVSPVLGVMNLIALSTGLVIEPKRMWKAFKRGCRSENLYRKKVRSAIDELYWGDVASIRRDLLEVKRPRIPIAIRAIEFALYSILAMLIHALIAIPALVARVVTDVTLGYSFFKIITPVKRSDLF